MFESETIPGIRKEVVMGVRVKNRNLIKELKKCGCALLRHGGSP